MSRHSVRRTWQSRDGAIAVKTIFVMMAMIGMSAFAIDIGFIMLTRTQLQAASDSSALAGGTELKAGLGWDKTKTPAEVQVAAETRAVEYADKNPNAERLMLTDGTGGSYADANRDIHLRTAWQEPDGSWTMSDPGVIERHDGYNAVTVNLLRNQDGSSNGDGPISLFLAPLIGTATQKLTATATAALLPVSGLTVTPGGGNAFVLPFAFDAATYCAFLEYTGTSPDDLPYYCATCDGCNDETITYTPVDGFTVNDDHTVSEGGDGVYEMDLYPHENKTITPGNRGTVDIGGGDNSSADIARQIVYGVSEEDMQEFSEDAELNISAEAEVTETAEGDTGISSGFKDELASIIGQCRMIPIFAQHTDEAGNNTVYTLVDIVGVVLVDVDLTGSTKHVWMQLHACQFDGTIGDGDGTITPNTTVFHPLILIE